MEFNQIEKKFKQETLGTAKSTSTSNISLLFNNNNNINNNDNKNNANISNNNQIFQFVSEKVELYEKYKMGFLDPSKQKSIKDESLQRLGNISPILKLTMEIKLVCNPRKNFINTVIRKDYISMIHYEKIESIFYCFFLSDKLEPFVIITAVDENQGKLHRLSEKNLKDLEVIIQKFKKSFGIHGESYHYTKLEERVESNDFTKNIGNSQSRNFDSSTKSHSSHWHLKMRISTLMCKDKLPILKMINFDQLKERVEPVKYNYGRETKSWSQTFQEMKEDLI